MGVEEKPFYDSVEILFGNVENFWGNVENFFRNVEKWKTTQKKSVRKIFFSCAFALCPEGATPLLLMNWKGLRLFSHTIKESNGFLFLIAFILSKCIYEQVLFT